MIPIARELWRNIGTSAHKTTIDLDLMHDSYWKGSCGETSAHRHALHVVSRPRDCSHAGLCLRLDLLASAASGSKAKAVIANNVFDSGSNGGGGYHEGGQQQLRA